MTQSAPQIVNPDPQFQSRDTPLQLDRRIGLYTGIAAGLIGLMFLSQGITQPVIQLFIIAAVFMLTALINIFSLETVNFKDPRVGVYVGLGALQLSLIIFALLFTNTSLIAA